MYLTKPHSVLVCLVFLLTMFAVDAPAWEFKQAAAPDQQEDLAAPQIPRTKAPAKIAAKKIMKCRPPAGRYGPNETVFDSLASSWSFSLRPAHYQADRLGGGGRGAFCPHKG